MRHRLSATASCPLAVKIVFGLSRSTTTNGQPLGSDLWSVSLLPKHPFVVGNHYDDRNGRYEVLAITGGKVKYRYTDGREKLATLRSRPEFTTTSLATTASATPLSLKRHGPRSGV